MFSIAYAVYLFVLATILSLIEIQIEGNDGWADMLPCWHPRPENWAVKLYSRIIGGKEVTGYHIFLNIFLFVVLHLPFFTGVKWGFAKEMEVFSLYFLFWICEDFLWFLWNDWYGLKRFHRETILWHKHWIGPVPRDYFVEVGVSAIFALGAVAFREKDLVQSFVNGWVRTVLILGGLILVSCLIQLIRKGRA